MRNGSAIMVTDILRLFLPVCILGITAFAAFGAGPTENKEPLYFTNKDIEKYASPADENVSPAAVKPSRKNDGSKDSREAQEKEYWCKKTAPCRKKTERVREEIQEIEKEIAENKDRVLSSHKSVNTLRKKLERTKKKLKTAEHDLSDIEEEAHRKGIPPGWLRCQFE
jgi:DNA-binding transcriptional MerR regulator